MGRTASFPMAAACAGNKATGKGSARGRVATGEKPDNEREKKVCCIVTC